MFEFDSCTVLSIEGHISLHALLLLVTTVLVLLVTIVPVTGGDVVGHFVVNVLFCVVALIVSFCGIVRFFLVQAGYRFIRYPRRIYFVDGSQVCLCGR